MTDERRQPVARPVDRVLNVAENLVYAGAGLLLALAAAAVVGTVAVDLVRSVGRGVQMAVTDALDGLLLAFILLELLAAVRATITERQLVAEPFLVAGIIASIKEIIVVALSATKSRGTDAAAFDDSVVQIGVLAGVVLLLSVATFLVRRKEREPAEAATPA